MDWALAHFTKEIQKGFSQITLFIKLMRFLLLLFLPLFSFGATLKVGKHEQYKTIKSAIANAKNGDVVEIEKGIYREGSINISTSITLLGKNRPVIDGNFKDDVIILNANGIKISGFKIINSGKDEVKAVSAIHLNDVQRTVIEQNIFENNHFAIYNYRGYQNLIQHNKIVTKTGTSQENSGDGVHILGGVEIWVKNNFVSGHKDGIYLEKSKKCFIYRNISRGNLRYGLHFMFSNDCVYSANVFDNNNAGVAVMYAMNVGMYENKFINNWGDSVYGILLKDISYSKIKNNTFENNTTGIYADGMTKVDLYKNNFKNNGWGTKINANCMENRFIRNNFINNTFDVSTNGSVVMNEFKQNYWDKYEGYDLNKDGIGDVPYHPLSMYSVLVEQNPSVMLLFRSFFMDLLDRTEKIIPSLTPDNFVDNEPLFRRKN